MKLRRQDSPHKFQHILYCDSLEKKKKNETLNIDIMSFITGINKERNKTVLKRDGKVTRLTRSGVPPPTHGELLSIFTRSRLTRPHPHKGESSIGDS